MENGKTSGVAYGSRSEHSDWLQGHRSIYIQSYSYATLDILSMDILIFFVNISVIYSIYPGEL